MKHTPAIAIVTLIALLTLTAACGDDGSTPGENLGGGENPGGETTDIAGVWQGTYSSTAGARGGTLCLDLTQDGREITGTATFGNEPVLQIGGTMATSSLAIVWSPQTGGAGSVTPASSASLQFVTGGTLTGDIANDAFTGVWNSISGEAGAWTASPSDLDACP